MKQLNRYYRFAKISERKTRQIVKYFALDLTANKTARLTGLTHQSVNRIYLKIRNRVAEEGAAENSAKHYSRQSQSRFGDSFGRLVRLQWTG